MAETDWPAFHLDYGDLDAVKVSLGLGALAMVVSAALGMPLALWLARARGPLRDLVEAIVMAMLLMPPLALGILLVSAYGPYSTAGELLDRLGLSLGNNAGAFVLSQVYGGMAYFILAARAAFETVPRAEEEAAWLLGASRFATFRRITLPLARPGLTAGLAIAWARAMGEFGIASIFAYFPQGIPVKLYVDLQNDGVSAVYALLWIMVAAALPLPLVVLFLTRGKRPLPSVN